MYCPNVAVFLCMCMAWVIGSAIAADLDDSTLLNCPLGYMYDGKAGNDTDQDPLLYHPRFHVMPPTRRHRPTGMNDLNAMFYFKGMYHITYQDHINCPDDVNQANQSFGHVVSRDLVSWQHLPPALVDVRKYDGNLGPWDGPGFICNGRPMMIYNSHANGSSFNAQTKTGAFPTDEDDLLLSNWTHVPLQPADAFIGPSTLAPPWQGNDGTYYAAAFSETTHKCELWRTVNCTQWSVVNANFNFCANNSPELYNTPPPCDNCLQEPPPENYSMVAKQCLGETDGYIFGKVVGENGAFDFIPTTQSGKIPWTHQDNQLFEVSKQSQFEDGRSAWTESLWDPVHSRRIMIGWVPPGVSPAYTKPFDGFAPLWHMCSLLRDVRYDNRFKMLTTYPIKEYEALRVGVVAQITSTNLSTSSPQILLGVGGRQLDIEVDFAMPSLLSTTPSVSFGVAVLRSSDSTRHTDITLSMLPPTPPTPPPSPPPPLGPYMQHTDLPGDDLRYFGVNYSDPHMCEASCNTESECKAWVYVTKQTKNTPVFTHATSTATATANKAESKPKEFERSETETETESKSDLQGFPVPRCCLKNRIPIPRYNVEYCTGSQKTFT